VDPRHGAGSEAEPAGKLSRDQRTFGAGIDEETERAAATDADRHCHPLRAVKPEGYLVGLRRADWNRRGPGNFGR
jgi:hypothetical protein